MKEKIFAIFAVFAMVVVGFSAMNASALSTSIDTDMQSREKVVIDSVSATACIRTRETVIFEFDDHTISFTEERLVGYYATVRWHIEGFQIIPVTSTATVMVSVGIHKGSVTEEVTGATSYETHVFASGPELLWHKQLPGAPEPIPVRGRAGVKFMGCIGTEEFYVTTYTYMSLSLRPKTVSDLIQELPEDVFVNNPDQRKNTLTEKLDGASEYVEAGEYQEAIDKLNHDIRAKMDGSLGGNPKNDWITDPDTQAELCTIIDSAIEQLETL